MGLTVADKLEIIELTARYNHAIDGLVPNPADAWADTFTEDGVFEAIGFFDPPLDKLEGRAQLREFAEGVTGNDERGYHWISNIVVDGDGASARLTCYLQALRALTKDGGGGLRVTGVYRDTLTKVNGAWKFQHRSVTFDN